MLSGLRERSGALELLGGAARRWGGGAAGDGGHASSALAGAAPSGRPQTCAALRADDTRPRPPRRPRPVPDHRHGLHQGRLHSGQDIHIHKHRLRHVQRRAAGDGGAAGVGPQHVLVVPVPVRGAVPRLVRLRAGRRPVAGSARVPRRRRRAPRRHHLPPPVRGGCGVPGSERGGVRRVDGGVAGGVVAHGAAGRAGAPRDGPDARPQARAARRRALPRVRAPRLRHARGGGARGAQQRVRDRAVRDPRRRTAGSRVCNGVPSGAAGARPGAGPGRGGAPEQGRLRGLRRQARLRPRRRRRRPRPAARLAQARQPRHVHHTRQNFLAGRRGRVGGAVA